MCPCAVPLHPVVASRPEEELIYRRLFFRISRTVSSGFQVQRAGRHDQISASRIETRSTWWTARFFAQAARLADGALVRALQRQPLCCFAGEYLPDLCLHSVSWVFDAQTLTLVSKLRYAGAPAHGPVFADAKIEVSSDTAAQSVCPAVPRDVALDLDVCRERVGAIIFYVDS